MEAIRYLFKSRKTDSDYSEYLDQARVMSRMGRQEKSDGGECARVIHKLAQACVADG